MRKKVHLLSPPSKSRQPISMPKICLEVTSLNLTLWERYWPLAFPCPGYVAVPFSKITKTHFYWGAGVFALVAPLLGIITNDIGPDPNYVWIALVYILTLAIGQVLVGRLSDLFGRRWFFILGSVSVRGEALSYLKLFQDLLLRQYPLPKQSISSNY